MWQQNLGDQIHVGKMTISDLERGEVELTLDYMRRISKVFELATVEILNEQDRGFVVSEEEKTLVLDFRKANVIQKVMINRVAKPCDGIS
jgi:DNA-binding XRE family transcriptional regulator